MTWVLLRGLTREARHWGSFAAQWAQQVAHDLPPARVITLDLPGNGRFAHQASPWAVRDMTEFARQHLRAASVAPPYQLLAMSLGGMVAIDWAQRHACETSRLVLINTSLRRYSALAERLRPGSWPALARLAASGLAPHTPARSAQQEQWIHRLTCEQTATRDDDVAAWMRIRQSAPVRPANALRQLWAAACYAPAERRPRCPVLVLSSAHDALVNPLCSERLAQAWQAGHRLHPWAGHDLPHDDADWVCRQVARWLDRN